MSEAGSECPWLPETSTCDFKENRVIQQFASSLHQCKDAFHGKGVVIGVGDCFLASALLSKYVPGAFLYNLPGWSPEEHSRAMKRLPRHHYGLCLCLLKSSFSEIQDILQRIDKEWGLARISISIFIATFQMLDPSSLPPTLDVHVASPLTAYSEKWHAPYPMGKAIYHTLSQR